MKPLSEEILAQMRKGNGLDRQIAAAVDAAVKAEREACIEALHQLPDVITGAGRLIDGALCRTTAIATLRARGSR